MVMEARQHYSARAVFLLVAPTAAAAPPSISPAPAALPGVAGALPGAGEAVEDGHGGGPLAVSFNTNAIVLLALLVCGIVAAVALHVVLQCALRVTRRACSYGADGAAGGRLQELPRRATAGRGGGGGHTHTGQGDVGRKRTPPLSKTIPRVAYTEGLELAGSSPSECAICLTEFARGEQLRVLPRCNHGFHPRCIDRWLAARPTCPTCRQAPFAAEPVKPEPDHAPAPTPGAVHTVRVIIVTTQ
ncbi:RING-H2 finger protein ATL72-like [Oryza brachyantha]|uniref:RING-H2 finger protein ATL72-like n=1 Tax=Oryza brachyantha TaxID=4533 RepID=UPI001AD98F50|nr:RING-H2 finger protein ATL72-like [Oryza brachyantha]